MGRSYDRHESVDVSDGDTALVQIKTQGGETVNVELNMGGDGGEAVLSANTDRWRESSPFRWRGEGD